MPRAENPTIAPTARFTDRVENYRKARPGYPTEVVSLLAQRCGLTQTSTLVDVGCGTGLLAEGFCRFGCRVVGVEPNAAMREAGQKHLAGFPNFKMLEGQSEAIPLPDAMADFITAGQAFHWFDLFPTRQEFKRILKTGGWVVLVWNNREFTGSPFAEDYENLVVRFGIDYPQVHQRGKSTPAAFEFFFGNRSFCQKSYPNPQELDREGFVARVLSSSYMPTRGHAEYPAMMQEVERIFCRHQQGGSVTVRYTTTVTFGQLT